MNINVLLYNSYEVSLTIMKREVLIPENGWIKTEVKFAASNTKIQAVSFRAFTQISKALGRNSLPDIFKVLSVNLSIFWRWLLFASRLMPYGKLSARERELIILRVAWLCKSRYEWGQHIEIGQRMAHLSDQDIIQITIGATAFFSSKEQLLLTACDEFIQHKSIQKNTWKKLAQHYQQAILLEISFLIGHYEMLAGILNSIGLELESDIESNYQAFNNRIEGLLK